MTIPGLLGAPIAVRGTRGHAPRHAVVHGTPHPLAYITAEEAALLRARDGGLTRDGRSPRGPAGLPAFDNCGDSGAADGRSNSSGPDGASDGNGGDGLANYLGALLPQGPDPRAAQRDAWRSALTAPIDQTPRNFIAGGAMPGAAAQAPVSAYNCGTFPAAPPIIGTMLPLPAAPAPDAPPASGGSLPPVPNLDLPSYAPPRYGAAGPAGNPSFDALLGRMR